MIANKGRKSRKLRGSRTHGWGSPKKHRGSGSRGGVGNAGMGKKGQQKMTLLFNTTGRKIGRSNLARPTQVVRHEKTINLKQIDERLDKLIESGAAKKKGTGYELDLGEIGYTKLLGTGLVGAKLAIKTERASARAIEKVKSAGGSVDVLAMPAEIIETPAAEAEAKE